MYHQNALSFYIDGIKYQMSQDRSKYFVFLLSSIKL